MTRALIAWCGIILLCSCRFVHGAAAASADALPLIPFPKSVTLTSGALPVRLSGRVICGDAAMVPLAAVFGEELHSITGLVFNVADGAAKPGDMSLVTDASLQGEHYQIDVTDHVTVRGGDYASIAMGTATLLQAVQVSGGLQPVAAIPKFKVDDEPAIAYRGAMLDLARNIHSVDSLKEMIRVCRFYKIRQLHLHLSDDQAFTFPSAAYPNLATANHSYTQDQLKDIVSYATARGVTIVPELDMPGHASALMKGMPELFKMERGGNVIDFRKPAVVEAAGKLVDELCEMFPDSPYIHLGGDEAGLGAFANDPATDAAFAATGVTDISGLFNYFLNQMNAHVKAHGKRSII